MSTFANMSTAPDSSEVQRKQPLGGDPKLTETSAEETSPVIGSSISRAQTFPFNLHSIRSKSPRPAPGPLQDRKPHDSQKKGSSRSQSKRTVSDPARMQSSPTSAKRASAAGSAVSSTSHHGRHANEWLFGGFSVRETIKGVWKGIEGKEK